MARGSRFAQRDSQIALLAAAIVSAAAAAGGSSQDDSGCADAAVLDEPDEGQQPGQADARM